MRAGSEDSVSSVGSRTSNASNASSRGGRTRKATRGAAVNRGQNHINLLCRNFY
jgi:hypothetical protein